MPSRNETFFGTAVDKTLREKLAKEHVLERESYKNGPKLAYLPAHFVINQANEIFGFGMWSTEIEHLQMLDSAEYEKPPYNAGEKPKVMFAVSYLCRLKLIVKAGTAENVYSDVGFGSGVANASPVGKQSAYELATKEAVTDALKRCLRYYGNQFGLSLYDKAEDPVPLSEVEAARMVTDEQLKKLRDLYPARDIDDEWILAALKAEHYPNDSLEEMRNDWYQLAYKIAYEYRLDDIENAAYIAHYEKVIGLMEKSGNMSMLKALFKEAWELTKKAEDKQRQLTAQKVYEKVKAKLTGEPQGDEKDFEAVEQKEAAARAQADAEDDAATLNDQDQ